MTIEEYLVKSNSYEETGDYSGMFSVLAEGIRMYPFGYELYYSLGFYYLRREWLTAHIFASKMPFNFVMFRKMPGKSEVPWTN